MKTALGYLTFCTNIFPGASWSAHFDHLKAEIPVIKQQLAPGQQFGIGLRVSNEASAELTKPDRLKEFQHWLRQNDCFVFTVNGFPFGNFHRTRVKDLVHAPDWATTERREYTLRLAQLLAALLPDGMEGSISTSPLSYKYWFANEPEAMQQAIERSTKNIVQLVLQLYKLQQDTGKNIHIDIEPEADGLIESSVEFIDWYQAKLLPEGIGALNEEYGLSEAEATTIIKTHVQLCYDVCHFAVGFEEAEGVIRQLAKAGIRIGKWQLSAALKINLDTGKEERLNALKAFDEPVYLHQVVAQKEAGSLLRYRDLPDAFADAEAMEALQWRSHFHVPLFIKDYGVLQSTQEEIVKVLQLQKEKRLSPYLEVETYTWEVLPEALKLPLSESVIREMKWVMDHMKSAAT